MKDLVLFCGCGGATEGLVEAGWDIGACVDGWNKACEAHRRWRPELPVIQARVEEAHKLLDSDFRFVWASPSCKPWSTANRTPKRGKAPYLVRQAFGAWRARWLVIENVGGLIWSKEGRAEMEELRAEFTSWPGLVLSMPKGGGTIASNTLGVAQLRRRVFLVIGPEHVAIRPGGEWIPPAGVGPLLWEAPERTQAAPMACEGSKGSWDTGFARASTAAILRDDHPNKWSDAHRYGRAAAGVVDASQPSRHANWTRAAATVPAMAEVADEPFAPGAHKKWPRRAGRGVTATGEDMHTSTDQRSREVNHTGRTLAECCALQCIPGWVVEGFSKRVAHELVGNAVPPPVAAHIGRLVLAADLRRSRAEEMEAARG